MHISSDLISKKSELRKRQIFLHKTLLASRESLQRSSIQLVVLLHKLFIPFKAAEVSKSTNQVINGTN